MPFSAKEEDTEEADNVVLFDLTDEVKNVDVNDPVEVIPVTEYSKEGEKRYSLDDYMEVENQLTNAKPSAKDSGVTEEALKFDKRVEPEEETVPSGTGQTDPLNSSIEDTLKLRAEERRKKLKEFNYKFQNNISRIDEIEKQPAYKRMGIELEDKKENNTSRTSLGTDSNDEIQLRSNNSFLHDNVD